MVNGQQRPYGSVSDRKASEDCCEDGRRDLSRCSQRFTRAEPTLLAVSRRNRMMNIKAGIRKASFFYGVRYFRDHRSQRSAIQRKEKREGRAERSSRNRASHVASPSPKPNNQPSPILLLFFYHLFMSGARSGWIMARSPTAYHTSHRKVGVEIAECWGLGF